MYELSKTKYCKGLQCPKMLWLDDHAPQLATHTIAESRVETGKKFNSTDRTKAAGIVITGGARCFLLRCVVFQSHVGRQGAVPGSNHAFQHGGKPLLGDAGLAQSQRQVRLTAPGAAVLSRQRVYPRQGAVVDHSACPSTLGTPRAAR